MDEIKERLKNSSESCVKAYEDWRKEPSDREAFETLHDAVHELRKVASRLEIEMAVSEREEMASKPIPIPSHRASKPGGKQQNAQEQEQGGSHSDSESGHQPEKVKKVTRRRRTPKKNEG